MQDWHLLLIRSYTIHLRSYIKAEQAQILYSGKVRQIYSVRAFHKKSWQINERLLIMVLVWQITNGLADSLNVSTTKRSHYTVY